MYPMNMIVLHKKEYPGSNDGGGSLLQFAVCTEPLAAHVFNRLSRSVFNGHNGDSIVMLPQGWDAEHPNTRMVINHYGQELPLGVNTKGGGKADPWFIICNGRYIVRIHYPWLRKILDTMQADVVAVNVTSELQAFYEKTLITSQNHLVGFRRFYGDSVRPGSIPNDWPHCLFIKTGSLDKAAVGDILPLDFTQFIDRCNSNSLAVQGLDVGGAVLDLNTEEGLIGLLRTELKVTAQSGCLAPEPQDMEIADSAKLFGEITFGRSVRIGPHAIIVGPAILGHEVIIGEGSVVRSSVLGPGVSVPPQCLIQNRVLLDSRDCSRQSGQEDAMGNKTVGNIRGFDEETIHFRKWPRFSYAGCFKRIADILIAVMVLLLFVPIILAVILVIKIFSPGPVFFKHKRQGMHGRAFHCLKFRTMITGADKMQEKIRRLNQVDGPQFRIDDDPRISSVGRFLRDTYLDEIPQFLNVLLGQMSIVGPRPSPEAENTLCPSWHDARLSVRPGVTGLWQICRTRQPMQDFQEWIYYDVKYVESLSLKMDMKICWMTAKKMFDNFIDQF
jgi:lipopolysaccharide/colanic/teichoic acid biosynthesis glycosyltransferase